MRVAVLGLGRVGRIAARMCLERPDLELAGAVVKSPEKDGVDIGALLGGPDLGIAATADAELLARDESVDALIYSGIGDPKAVAETLGLFAGHGKTCSTVSGLVHPETALGAAAARELDERARRGGGRIVGAGWNPGFLLDLLPVVWGGSGPGVRHVTAVRVCDLVAWGDGVREHLGIGSTRTIEPGSWASIMPVEECVRLVSDALGLGVDEVSLEFEPRVATARRTADGRTVEAGETVGFRAMGSGLADGVERVRLGWDCVFAMDPETDGLEESARVAVVGDSTVEAVASGDTLANGYPPTAKRGLDILAPLSQMPPGLYRPDQVPLTAR